MVNYDNINYILCYLSIGVNEVTLLSKSILDNKSDKDLLEKIQLSFKGFMTSEKFCNVCML